MKNLFKSAVLGLGVVAMTFNSCSDDDNVIDQVFDGVTNGAVLRALNDTADNDPIIIGAGNTYTIQIEEQDVQDGGLMDFVNVYVRFNDRTILGEDSASGAGTDFSTPAGTDVLMRTIQADEFSTDTPFGLPRMDIDITEADFASLLPNEHFNSGDDITVRLELHLTDGRVFSVNNAGGIITGFGSFFSSPFQHTINLDSGIGINYIAEGRNSYLTPEVLADLGLTNDYSITGEITDQESGNNIVTVNVYKRFSDLTTLDGSDNSVPEVLMDTFNASDFGTSPDGFPTIDVFYDQSDLLGTLTDDDLSVGDAFFIRYEVITNDGRTITNELEATDFYDRIEITDCPFPPLDETTSFTGDYLAEQIVSTIFGYDTFDPDGGGVVLTLYAGTTDASQEEPGIALDNNQRSFDADYIAALGFGNTDTYIMEFNLCKVTITDGAGPVDGSTGVTCTQNDIVLLGPADGGVYNAEDDNEFTLIFAEDLLQDCGQGDNFPQIKFTKVTN